MTYAEFAEECGLTCEVLPTDAKNPSPFMGMDAYARQYSIEVTNELGTLTEPFHFTCGSLAGEPTLEDLLLSLALDYTGVYNAEFDTETYMSEFLSSDDEGWDSVETCENYTNVIELVKQNHRKLKALLTSDQLEKLYWSVEVGE